MRDTLIDVGGYRLHFRIAAGRTDEPVVVLDAGGGLDAEEWRSLQPRLERETGATVVSYDRAGFGSSDLPATAFDFRGEVEGLHAGLRALGFADRVILVGHSYAGFTLQLYAGDHGRPRGCGTASTDRAGDRPHGGSAVVARAASESSVSGLT